MESSLSALRVVGCFVENEGEFVILRRHHHKPDGDTWGLPGGKVEGNESDSAAMVRELQEETGYHTNVHHLQHMGNFDFVSTRGEPYTYITYRLPLQQPFPVQLENSSHSAYDWVTPEECYAKSDLISDFHLLLKLTGYIH